MDFKFYEILELPASMIDELPSLHETEDEDLVFESEQYKVWRSKFTPEEGQAFKLRTEELIGTEWLSIIASNPYA
jgi:hypothetical protein